MKQTKVRPVFVPLFCNYFKFISNILKKSQRLFLQSLPQTDPDEDERNSCSSSQWRITVNPSANFFSASDELKSLINKLYRTQVYS